MSYNTKDPGIGLLEQVGAWAVEYRCFVNGLKEPPVAGREYFEDVDGIAAVRLTKQLYDQLGDVEFDSIELLHLTESQSVSDRSISATRRDK